MTMAQTMLAIEISSPGGPEVLRPVSVPVPRPAAGEVLIKVFSAGVNRPDIHQRRGAYPPPAEASPYPGLEVSGEIVQMGADVAGLQEGDRVCALSNGGGYAQYVAVPAGQCLPVPGSLSWVEAASLPETCFTVWSNVFDRAGLTRGETFLVHGGGSGIGCAAIQMARAAGARVFTTAGSEQKCGRCRELGAEIAINYRNQDYVPVLKEATAGRGVDVILDMVAGTYVQRNLELAAIDGRIVMIATLGGASAEIDARTLIFKRLSLSGSTLRPRTPAEKAAIATALRNNIWPLLESGDMRPVIDRVFPFADVAQAHSYMESSRHFGKIMLDLTVLT
ncbi:MAG: NAD(P)H-quinone oxidoreductase [Pseudomonadales bacterium]|nr:NAD(P)H-quinone oxidoreductase [Pseudomonadales bacterium]